MGIPPANCQSTNAAAGVNRCALSAVAMDLGFGDWVPLLNFRPPGSVSSGVVKRAITPARAALGLLQPVSAPIPYGSIGYQPIDMALGDVNFDFYAVDITKTPDQLEGAAFSAERLFEMFRKKIPDLLDHSVAILNFYEPADTTSWATTSPLGTLGRFTMKGPFIDADSALNAVDPMSPDACVVCADYASDHWIFSTVQIPWLNKSFNGVHPVNGNRQFGFGIRKAGEAWSPRYEGKVPTRQVDTLFWYTRGVDRTAAIPQFAATPGTVFAGGHSCWLGLQRKCAEWLKGLGATIEYDGIWESRRWPWDMVKDPANGLWKV